MSELRTDFKDDVLDVTQNEKRKYRIIHNDDGTISLEDATVYLQQGDSFGANDINEMNRMANQMDKAAGEILTMAEDIDTLQSDVDTLESVDEGLDSRVTTLESDVDTLDTNVSDLQTNKADSSDLEWKLVGSVTGTTQITLPSDFNEIEITTGYSSVAQFSKRFSRQAMETMYNLRTSKVPYRIYRASNESVTWYFNMYALFIYTDSYYGGSSSTNIASSATTTVYYR